MSKIIWQKDYEGFEDLSDYFRDTDEAVDPRFNPNMAEIPGEFQGTIRVTIEYIEEEENERN